MKSNATLGKEGERKAIEYLTRKGWVILAQNYRYKRGELDIIGLENEVLVFVEVKYRKSNRFGFPEDFVDDHKVKMIRTTATNYIEEKNWLKDIRFDIISITDREELKHFRDAF
ncbi:MAG TPA: YraN family protein [Cytophagaceae bacterium]|jgi:putative endonuclease|nr:YraN family protein [Cytophagaceae bacterium]